MPAKPLHPGEALAREVREALGLRCHEPVGDLVASIEARAHVPVFLTPLPRGIAGLANRLDGRWYIVGDSGTGPSGRLRFTLAHELGHVVMGHSPAVDDDDSLSKSGPNADPQEVAANSFAAELLIPRDLIYSETPEVPGLAFVMEIAGRFGTTPWVPFYRLRTLGYLDKTEALMLEAEIRSAGAAPEALSDTAARYAGSGETRTPSQSGETL